MASSACSSLASSNVCVRSGGATAIDNCLISTPPYSYSAYLLLDAKEVGREWDAPPAVGPGDEPIDILR